jgi:hypothetical protein
MLDHSIERQRRREVGVIIGWGYEYFCLYGLVLFFDIIMSLYSTASQLNQYALMYLCFNCSMSEDRVVGMYDNASP